MKLKYHGYSWPRQCESFWMWLFDWWHDFYAAQGGGVVEDCGVQVCGFYAIWSRVLKEDYDV